MFHFYFYKYFLFRYINELNLVKIELRDSLAVGELYRNDIISIKATFFSGFMGSTANNSSPGRDKANESCL